MGAKELQWPDRDFRSPFTPFSSTETKVHLRNTHNKQSVVYTCLHLRAVTHCWSSSCCVSVKRLPLKAASGDLQDPKVDVPSNQGNNFPSKLFLLLIPTTRQNDSPPCGHPLMQLHIISHNKGHI